MSDVQELDRSNGWMLEWFMACRAAERLKYYCHEIKIPKEPGTAPLFFVLAHKKQRWDSYVNYPSDDCVQDCENMATRYVQRPVMLGYQIVSLDASEFKKKVEMAKKRPLKLRVIKRTNVITY